MIFVNQPHQHDCRERILAALKNIDFSAPRDEKIRRLHENLSCIAKDNGYPDFPTSDRWGMDILMETGTGKTFTYLDTIYNLHNKFGLNKFIIVLPRIAIKSGVVQNIELTRSHFHEIYKKHLNVIKYPDDGLPIVNQKFVKSHDLSVMVTTASSFNSAKNKINQSMEALIGYGSILDEIINIAPVIILDEPHLLKGEQTSKYLGKLEDSLFIRFGASFPKDEKHNLSNVAYMLDSISAFRNDLVKQIRVNTVYAEGEVSGVRAYNIKSRKRFDAHFHINKQPRRKIVRINDDLGAVTGLDQYSGRTVKEITLNRISLSDKSTLDAATKGYNLSDTEVQSMIAETIKLHFDKEMRNFEIGIKTLSLFFIPSIRDYRGESPRIKTMFEEEYKIQQQKIMNKARGKYKNFLKKDFNENHELVVHNGYFSGDKGTSDEKEKEAVDAILNDKLKLLSLDYPLRFIFSVWALQEGWDNPNVFNICKLSPTPKDTSRRQQVGRGLRLAVTENGNRIDENNANISDSIDANDINILDTIISAQEENFIHEIQNEINENNYSIESNVFTMDRLKQLGLTDAEIVGLIGKMMCWGIIRENINGEGFTVHDQISPYLQKHRKCFPHITDERFKVIIHEFDKIMQRQQVSDGNKPPLMVKIKPNEWHKFKEMWETINKKAEIVYKDICDNDILNQVVTTFRSEEIYPDGSKTIAYKYDCEINQLIISGENRSSDTKFFMRRSIGEYAHEFSKNEKIPLRFALDLFNELSKENLIEKFKTNPSQSGNCIKNALKESIHSAVLQKISYEFNQIGIYPNKLQSNKGEVVDEIASGDLGRFRTDGADAHEGYLYDSVVYDSTIEENVILERPIPINDKEIIVYAKLPKINIPTPYKHYNPDFAYVIKNGKGEQLFLVVETKGYDSHGSIPEDEKKKMEYGKHFFKALQKALPSTKILYKKRITNQSLGDLVAEIMKGEST